MNLVKAAAKNDIRSVRLLLDNGADVNGRYPWSSLYTPSPLFQTPPGQPDKNRPSDVIEPVQYEACPLHVAAMAGYYEIVCLLVEAGADILGKDGMGRTPLTCSIYGLDTLTVTAANLPYISQSLPSHLSILRLLAGLPALKNLPFDPTTAENHSRQLGFNSRRLTLSSRHKLEGDLGPIDHPHEEIKGITPLCLAAYLGKEAAVKALLQEGLARVNATDQNGATALMYAARDGHLRVVRTLLAHHAAPDITDDNGWSAIQYGQMYPEIVRLFEHGLRAARPKVIELLPFSEIALSYPRLYPELYACLKEFPEPPLLTAMNEDFDPLETHAVLVAAIKQHDHQKIQSIILTGRSGRPASEKFPLIINSHDPSTGLSPLHHAVKSKPAPSLDTIVAIFQSGVDINVQSHRGSSALHHLCRLKAEHSINGDEIESAGTEDLPRPTAQHLARCASLLIHFGALLSVGDRHGNTPLHFAAETGGCLAVVKTLVHAGADTEKKNGKGLLPREVAKNPEIKQYLEAHAANLDGLRRPDAILEADNPDSVSSETSSLEPRRRSSWQHRQLEKSAIQARENRGIVPEHLRSQLTRNPSRHFSIMPEIAESTQEYDSGRRSVQRTGSNASDSSDFRRLARTGNATDSYIAAASASRASYQADQEDSVSNAGSTYEAELNFHQVIENLEYYHSHAAPAIEQTLSIITQQLSRAMQLTTPEDGNVTESQRSFQTREVCSLAAQLRGDLQLTYQLITVTEGQHRDVVSWQKSQLDAANALYEHLIENESTERLRLAELNKLHARLTQDVNRLLAENSSVKKKIQRQRKQAKGKLYAIVSSLQTEHKERLLLQSETSEPSGEIEISDVSEESEHADQDSLAMESTATSATIVPIEENEKSRIVTFAQRLERLEKAIKSETESSVPEGGHIRDKKQDGRKTEKAEQVSLEYSNRETDENDISTFSGEEETVESLEMQMAILTANLEEIKCDIAEQDAAILLILRDMKAVHMRCLEFDRSATPGEVFIDSNAEEIHGLMAMAEELHEEHKTMVHERRQLELEREKGERERENVQATLRKKSPRDLLRGLLGTLDVRQPTRKMEIIRQAPQVQPDYDISFQLVDVKLAIQILESTLFSLDVLSTRQIEGLFYNLTESRNFLDGVEKELTGCEVNVRNIEYEMQELSEAVGEIQKEVERIIKHRKDEVENVWDLVYDLSGGGRRLSIESNGTQHSFTSAASAAAARRSPFLMGVVEEEEDEFMGDDEVHAKREQHEQKKGAEISAKAAEATAAVGAAGAKIVGDGNARFLSDLDRLLTAHGTVLNRIVALRQAVADANRHRLSGVRHPLDGERLRLLGDSGNNGVASEAKRVYDYLRSLSDSQLDAKGEWKATGLVRDPFRKEYHLLYPVTSLNPLDARSFAGKNEGRKIEHKTVPEIMKIQRKHHKRSFSDSTATYTFTSTEIEKTVTSHPNLTADSSPVHDRSIDLFHRPTSAVVTRKRCISLEYHESARISIGSQMRRFSYEAQAFPLLGSDMLVENSVVASQNDQEGGSRGNDERLQPLR